MPSRIPVTHWDENLEQSKIEDKYWVSWGESGTMSMTARKRGDKRRNRGTPKAQKIYTREGDLRTKQPMVPTAASPLTNRPCKIRPSQNSGRTA